MEEHYPFFASVIGAPAGIASASFSLVFSLVVGIIKEVLEITKNQKKRHNKIFLLAEGKLSIIETLMSQALIDLEISYEEFKTIVNEKKVSQCEIMY